MFLPFKDSLPKTSFPLVTALLIAINVAIYFIASSNPFAAQYSAVLYGFIPYELTHAGTQCVPSPDGMKMICRSAAEIKALYPSLDLPPTWLTVVSSMFFHGDFWHLAFNMLALYVFGCSLENALGRVSYTMFYLVGGFAAVLGQTVWNTDAMGPGVGASGAIAAVMAGYLVLFPSAKIWSLFIVFPMRVRAIWVCGSWIAINFLEAYVVAGLGISGGVAYWAHIGGFVAGVGLTYLVVSKDQIEEYRRIARISSGLMVEPLVPYDPGFTHPSQRYVPQGQAAQQAYVAPHPQQPYVAPHPQQGFVPPQPGGPAFVAQAGLQQNLWSPPQPAQAYQPAPQQLHPPMPNQQHVVPPDPFAPEQPPQAASG